MQDVFAYLTTVSVDELTLLTTLDFQTNRSYSQFCNQFAVEERDTAYC